LSAIMNHTPSLTASGHFFNDTFAVAADNNRVRMINPLTA
jgi:hypothetical protein